MENKIPKKRGRGIRIKSKDHLGNEYGSFNEMCRAYNRDEWLVHRRLYRGWSLERALTEKSKAEESSVCKDHLGNEYKTFNMMCNAYNKSFGVVQYRLESGYTLEEALTTDTLIRKAPTNKKESIDHLNNVYPSFKEMCKAYDIKEVTVRYRLNNGWSLERALTEPPSKKKTEKGDEDKHGTE